MGLLGTGEKLLVDIETAETEVQLLMRLYVSSSMNTESYSHQNVAQQSLLICCIYVSL